MSMEERARKRLELFAERQKESGRLSCPRCGGNTMRSDLLNNAHSRHFDIYICPECGTDEALRDMFKNPIKLSDWRAAGGRFGYGK